MMIAKENLDKYQLIGKVWDGPLCDKTTNTH